MSRDKHGWPTGSTAPRILHVTESLAAGVGKSLSRLVDLQQQEGAECTVLAVRRYDTPDERELRRWLGTRVRLVLPTSYIANKAQLLWLASQLALELLRHRYDVVHLHSSFAGAIGRLIAPRLVPSARVFYSPHGLAFLRRDLSVPSRRAILLIERLLAGCSGSIIAVSESERRLVLARLTPRVQVLRNGIDTKSLPAQVARTPGRPVVAMLGRVAFQKAPWRFAKAAYELKDRADFMWLGYGEPEDVERWLNGSPVKLSGPLEHAALLRQLATVDLVYFPTLWEAMPMALLEAQALGIPCVVSDVDGSRDIVENGVTGLVRQDESDMLTALSELLNDPARMAQMGAAAASRARAEFSDALLGRKSLEVYADAIGGRIDAVDLVSPEPPTHGAKHLGRRRNVRVTG